MIVGGRGRTRVALARYICAGSGGAVQPQHFVAARARDREHMRASELAQKPRAGPNRDRGGSRANQGGAGQSFGVGFCCAVISSHFVITRARVTSQDGWKEVHRRMQLGLKRVSHAVRAGGGGRSASTTAESARSSDADAVVYF